MFFLTSQAAGWAEGHKSFRTIEIYTHVSMKSLKKIKSPFDEMNLKSNKNHKKLQNTKKLNKFVPQLSYLQASNNKMI